MFSAAVQGLWVPCLLSTTCALCRERLHALKGELAKEEDKAKQQSAAQLQSITAEAGRLEAAARQEGEARCSTVQVHCLAQTYRALYGGPAKASQAIRLENTLACLCTHAQSCSAILTKYVFVIHPCYFECCEAACLK